MEKTFTAVVLSIINVVAIGVAFLAALAIGVDEGAGWVIPAAVTIEMTILVISAGLYANAAQDIELLGDVAVDPLKLECPQGETDGCLVYKKP
jgi:hypothetical protein